ncbi:MAG: bifunctional enoyl-CoA hydratase/phosphate acetyltransferase [Candidatus Mcinerneyibacterium aminivorans]|uniref:Bifunctional enoyl-CoA hydratase/phosphate acetyltransferase n=1 Tax=Candidatus Mcinerneyibacterium aminivorans TaxID=2703815 RepID=A0A5D0MJ41_9BACT|nr:MAG: bifunctional enoyl-CoA hydratase/phosphate acetyltransferase [Candidatus Mcinerneyibacterium aminivorans]
MIESFKTLEKQAKNEKSKRVAVANAEEADVLTAIVNAANQNIVKPVLVGNEEGIKKLAEEEGLDISSYRIVDVERDEKEISKKAVELVKKNEADLLMKGKVSTSYLMKAVLDKEKGLRGGGVLSHLTLMEIKKYHKFLIITDAAVTISPDLKQKIGLINNAVYAAKKLGIEKPKVGVVGVVEKVNPEVMPTTEDAALLSKMNDRGQIKDCIVDGPFALDNAISEKSCRVKGIKTDVGGDADILLLPNIEAANIMYKTIAYLTDNDMAGVIMGAQVPIILTSRSDKDRIKYLSILTGVSMV